jgi:hypothetical protein
LIKYWQSVILVIITMLNFVNHNYDVIDITNPQDTIVKIKRGELDKLITTNQYLVVKEYINPKFNILLPHEMQFHPNYYIYHNPIEGKPVMVKMSKEYWDIFMGNNWSVEDIFNRLKSGPMTKYSKGKDNIVFQHVLGINWKVFGLVFLFSGVLMMLLYNFVSNPWSLELVGDNNKVYNSVDIIDYNGTKAPIKFNDTPLGVNVVRQEEANWTQFKNKHEIKYSLCQTSINTTYILVSSSKALLKDNCEGEGVITPLAYPSFNKPISDYLPANIIQRYSLDPQSQVNFKEGIESITNNLELRSPTYMIYADTKIVSQRDIDIRLAIAVFISVTPTILGLLELYRARSFRLMLTNQVTNPAY